MAQSIPSASVLLTAAVKYLEEALFPGISGYHRFKTRVTANVLNIVRRELELRDRSQQRSVHAFARWSGATVSSNLSAELSQLIRQGAVI